MVFIKALNPDGASTPPPLRYVDALSRSTNVILW